MKRQQAALDFFAEHSPDLVVAATGHRPDDRRPWHGVGSWSDVHIHRPVQAWLGLQLDALMGEARAQGRKLRVIAGGAVGVDTWFLEAALQRRLHSTLAMPFQGQELEWPQPSQRFYRELAGQCAEVVNVSGHDEALARARGAPRMPMEKVRRLMHQRDRWMVDHCNLLLEVWTGAPGGTGYTCKYAEDVGRAFRRLDPRMLRG